MVEVPIEHGELEIERLRVPGELPRAEDESRIIYANGEEGGRQVQRELGASMQGDYLPVIKGKHTKGRVSQVPRPRTAAVSGRKQQRVGGKANEEGIREAVYNYEDPKTRE